MSKIELIGLCLEKYLSFFIFISLLTSLFFFQFDRYLADILSFQEVIFLTEAFLPHGADGMKLFVVLFVESGSLGLIFGCFLTIDELCLYEDG